MRRKFLLAGLIAVSVFDVLGLPASASTARPTITSFKPKSATVGTEVTINGTNLEGTTGVTFNGTTATVKSNTATKIGVYVPAGATTGYIEVKTAGGTAKSVSKFTVLASLNDVMNVVSGGDGYCALLTSGGVKCWGAGDFGELGNGSYYTRGKQGSATPVAVKAAGGTGSLTGVRSLVGGVFGYCALLTSEGVDCWGYGEDGQLGNGTFYTDSPYGSAIPVAVKAVGATGSLTGVTSLVGGLFGYCAVVTSGGVDCWGNGSDGMLGNGTISESATPVAVKGVEGTGRLAGTKSLVGESFGYCALLTSGGVDCWGDGSNGMLGNGKFSESATPVIVQGLGGTGALTEATSLVGGVHSVCALLTTDGVDCWGYGPYGQLGDGVFYATGNDGSATPVAVEAVEGTEKLTGVTSLAGDSFGYCAVITSGAVNCWGYGFDGELGNGTFYTSGNEGSATPVIVVGVGDNGSLAGVRSLDDDDKGYCAVLTSGGVNCWGVGLDGELGNGAFYKTGNRGSDSPVEVG